MYLFAGFYLLVVQLSALAPLAAAQSSGNSASRRLFFFGGSSCSQDLACSDGVLPSLFGGVQLRSGYFDQCQSKCSPSIFAFLDQWWGGFECGVCGGEFAVLPNEVVNHTNVEFLASDELGGREDDTPGAIMAADYLVDELESMGAIGLDDKATGRDAFLQSFSYCQGRCDENPSFNATNVLAYIAGSELPDEYVVVGARYDHLNKNHSYCIGDPNSDSEICNGCDGQCRRRGNCPGYWTRHCRASDITPSLYYPGSLGSRGRWSCGLLCLSQF